MGSPVGSRWSIWRVLRDGVWTAHYHPSSGGKPWVGIGIARDKDGSISIRLGVATVRIAKPVPHEWPPSIVRRFPTSFGGYKSYSYRSTPPEPFGTASPVKRINARSKSLRFRTHQTHQEEEA